MFQRLKKMRRDGFGNFKQSVVRSGDIAHRPVAQPRLTPIPAVEPLVAPVRPSLTKDGFSTDDSTRNTI